MLLLKVINNQKIFVALSGGVDSAVSALLLKHKGYDVTGVFMKNWAGDDFGIQDDCPWEEDQKAAEEVCGYLDIPFRSFNFEKQYRESVVSYFFDEYSKGQTPNPDVMCNKEIKFKLFLNKALEEGADLIATGHYVRRKVVDNVQESLLLKGIDSKKDQSYFLYNITQEQLSKTLFPIGHLEKPEVRKIAVEAGLPNAKRPDSQGICFIGKINVLNFLMSKIPKKVGNIVDIETGKIVGEHNGVYFYTIGQRAKLPNQNEAYFYCDKNIEDNILYACHGHENKNLFIDKVCLGNLHLINNSFDIDALSKAGNLTCMIRYRQEPQRCRINIVEMAVEFKEEQRGVASGQSIVFFDNDVCLGGGVMKRLVK